MAVGRELLAAAEAAEASLRYTVNIYDNVRLFLWLPLSLFLSLSLSLPLSLWCGVAVLSLCSFLLHLPFSLSGVAVLFLCCFLLMTLMSARYPQNCGVTAPL